MNRKQIFDKANKEHQRLSGFDLMHGDKYISGSMTLSDVLSKNNQWLLDHCNDVEHGMLAHMKKELDAED